MESPLNAEYTLCGDACDLSAVDAVGDPVFATVRGDITCPRCCKVIKACLAVKGNRIKG